MQNMQSLILASWRLWRESFWELWVLSWETLNFCACGSQRAENIEQTQHCLSRPHCKWFIRPAKMLEQLVWQHCLLTVLFRVWLEELKIKAINSTHMPHTHTKTKHCKCVVYTSPFRISCWALSPSLLFSNTLLIWPLCGTCWLVGCIMTCFWFSV